MDYIKKKEKEKMDFFTGKKFYTYYSVFVLIYLLAINNMANSFLSVIAVLLAVPYFFAPEEGLPVLFVCAMNGEYMVAFQGVGMARIYTLVFIAGALYKIVSEGTMIDFKQLALYGLFSVFVFFSAYTSLTGEIEVAFTYFLNFGMAFLMAYIKADKKELLKNLFNLTTILSVYYFYLVVINSGWGIGSNRGSIDEAVNPNALAMTIAQLIAFLFAYFFLVKNIKKKIFVWVLLVLNGISLIYTGSRSALVGVVGSVVLCLILISFSKNKQIKGLNPFVILFIIIAFVGVYIFVSNNAVGILDRFSFDSIKESGGTGRLDIWRIILTRLFPEYPIFGVGCGGTNVYVYVSRYLEAAHGAHNLLLSVLAQMGLAGVLLFVGYLIYIFVKLIRKYKSNPLVLVPFSMFMAIIFNGIGEDTLGTRIMWFAIGLGLMMCQTDISDREPKAKKEISRYIKK